MDKDSARHYYVTTAIQYHIAARFAAFAGFSYVCGVLFHHAVEMYLKGQLCLTHDENQLRKFSHNLLKSWKAYKEAVSWTGPGAFEDSIRTLNDHEELRYPDRIAPAGAVVIDFSRPKSSEVLPESKSKLNRGKYFTLYVDDLDALASAILQASKLNPPYFTAALNSDASEFLRRENKSPIW